MSTNKSKLSFDVDELINKLFNLLNELINKNDLSVRITNSSNELLGTLKTTKIVLIVKNIL